MKRVFFSFLLFFVAFSIKAQYTLSGKVTGENNEALAGANIVIADTYMGTGTDKNGEFLFQQLKQGKYRLKISFIGYEKMAKTIHLNKDTFLSVKLNPTSVMADEVIVSATRASEKAPLAFSSLSKDELEQNNLGQDIPYILSLTPSLVTTSDAGAGIGYTGMRIRGSDATRINVTVNGIPLNDAESQGVFWVNMPDFTTSVDNLQIQRGVGTSTNGAAAFGATVNLQTETLNKQPYAEINTSAGSFNTIKANTIFGTGLINDKFAIDGRLSRISSDGFIDRAWSDLKSYFLSASYYGGESLLKFNLFSGEEHTYQAWYGVPEVKLYGTREDVLEYIKNNWITGEDSANLVNANPRTYNPYLYDNETDNYNQTHYQLIYSREIGQNWHFNAALHYTRGEGYFEQYKKNQDFITYGIDTLFIGEEVITNTDAVQRQWLDNDFYGATYSLRYQKNSLNLTLGGAWNQYDGDHFGTLIWAEFASDSDIRERWYDNNALKTDMNIFAKADYQLTGKLNFYGDIQFRQINYKMKGVDDYLDENLKPMDITQNHHFDFFNPKFGLFYQINQYQNAYFSYSVGHREPTRSNYLDAVPYKGEPEAETLFDYEMGYKFAAQKVLAGINFYYMDYDNQLVSTGKLNDVGSPIMTNVDKSYRLGVEFIGGIKLFEKLQWDFNLTLSRNKILNFDEYIVKYAPDFSFDGYLINQHQSTDISYSPEIIASNMISVEPFKNFKINLMSKYVGEQYFDNTSSEERKLDAYFVNDLRFDYLITPKFMKAVNFQLKINNLFDVDYENNAYGGNYRYNGTEQTWAYYFPQAGIHFLAGISVKF